MDQPNGINYKTIYIYLAALKLSKITKNPLIQINILINLL